MGGLRGLVGKFVALPDEKPEAKPGGSAFDDLTVPDPAVPGAPVAPVAPPTTPLDWSLPTIFEKGGADTGRNSADTVLKLAASLAQFPEAQRLAMVRALDAADESWDEPHVVADARKRVAILMKFVSLIDGDVQNRTSQINAAFEGTKTANDGQIAELDRQIALLREQRETFAHETTKAREAADGQVAAVQSKADVRRREAQEALDRYAALITFFGQS